ncbi:uncharacterized protein [Coffea arabica]|uniref:CCHC-type domain-containing protein n=1 Tax=Coffea arabica TaxID=13443 RepID=A0ABM4VUP8_COFAR
MAIMSFLASLSPEFETAKFQILSSPEISSLQDVFSKVLRTENSQSVQSSSALVSQTNKYEFGKQQYKGGDKGIDTRGQNAEVVVCHYCHKSGHIKRDCKRLQYKNQRTQSAHIASTNDAIIHEKSVTISTNEFAKFSQYQESLKSSSTPVTPITESGKPNTCIVSSFSKWVIDSGATDHMTGNSSLFSTFQPHTSASIVTLADGSKSRVLGSGSVNPTPLISLSSVLSLPELSFNLISMSKLIRALNCSTQFFPDYCLFQDFTTKQIIGKGHESGGLYILDTQIPKSIACSEISLSSLDYESCQFAKHHRVNLSPRVNKQADALFALVYSDVWGPNPITSKTGFKYFVALVDDHSHPVSSDDLPIALSKALSHPGRRNAMIKEMNVLDGNDTWNLVNLPVGKKAIGSKWVFTVKFNPDGSVARLKARLIARGYAQIYGEDYSDTFSPIAKLTSVRYQEYLSYGDLQEEVYMEKPPGFVAQGEFEKLTKEGELLEDPGRYRRLVGKLNYLTVTHLDIAYSVSVASQYMCNPTVNHWAAVEQILCYLKRAPGHGILYKNHGHTKIECFSNANRAGSKAD